MALKKAITTIQGVVVEYWRITRYNIDTVNCAIEIELMPYVSKEVRVAGNQPFETNRMVTIEYDRVITVDGIEQVFNAYNTYFAPSVLSEKGLGLVEAMYLYVKENVPFFKDAEDC